ncbi:MAG: hypothetical protein IJU54_01515 [Alphaproteobacteria bacterium]|nr:hypothetical protein [Alphaproteobacteria bacterium]
MINNLLKVVLFLGITTGTMIQNEAVSMQNVLEDEDVFNKYNKQSEGFSKQYKIDAQVILGNSLQLLNNSETALVQITNKLKDIISQG